MPNKLDLSTAEDFRLEVTAEQQRDIERMYKRISRNIHKEAAGLPDTTSGTLRRMYLKELQKQINEELAGLGKDLEHLITSNVGDMADAVIESNLSFLHYIDMPIQGAFSHVSSDIVKSVLSGQVYDGDWSLSKAIWKHTQKTQQDINKIIAEGIAQNKSAYDIAKDLEKYVNPSARKPWDWSKVYPGTAMKVDYNAQRLARTLISHAYQQAFVRTTQKNPFVTKYRWDASNSTRVCKLCASRDGVLFEKDDLPLDHPNGMCTFIAVMSGSRVEIADRIADWVDGKPDPALDEYLEFLRNS